MKLTLTFKAIFSNKISIQSSLFQKEITIYNLGKNRDNSVLKDQKLTTNTEAS
jgi:hypothetical protein